MHTNRSGKKLIEASAWLNHQTPCLFFHSQIISLLCVYLRISFSSSKNWLEAGNAFPPVTFWFFSWSSGASTGRSMRTLIVHHDERLKMCEPCLNHDQALNCCFIWALNSHNETAERWHCVRGIVIATVSASGSLFRSNVDPLRRKRPSPPPAPSILLNLIKTCSDAYSRHHALQRLSPSHRKLCLGTAVLSDRKLPKCSFTVSRKCFLRGCNWNFEGRMPYRKFRRIIPALCVQGWFAQLSCLSFWFYFGF